MTARGPYAKSTQTRNQILTAALELISHGGYSSASLQQIADAVGMTKAGLLHHFGSREALFTAVLDRRDKIDTEGIEAGDQIDGFIRLAEHNSKVPGLVALFSAITGMGASEPHDSASRIFTDAHYARIVPILAAAIARRQHADEIVAGIDPTSLARLLVAATDGLQTQWLLDPTINMRAELETLLGSFRP
jgi:AcrR family transcriptional regulator